jgi:hypothetical protein
MCAALLFGGGLLLFHYGSELNLEAIGQEQTLWDNDAGDVWHYAGGVMMLISGSLSLAAVKLWWGKSRRSGASLSGLNQS